MPTPSPPFTPNNEAIVAAIIAEDESGDNDVAISQDQRAGSGIGELRRRSIEIVDFDKTDAQAGSVTAKDCGVSTDWIRIRPAFPYS